MFSEPHPDILIFCMSWLLVFLPFFQSTFQFRQVELSSTCLIEHGLYNVIWYTGLIIGVGNGNVSESGTRNIFLILFPDNNLSENMDIHEFLPQYAIRQKKDWEWIGLWDLKLLRIGLKWIKSGHFLDVLTIAWVKVEESLKI